MQSLILLSVVAVIIVNRYVSRGDNRGYRYIK